MRFGRLLKNTVLPAVLALSVLTLALSGCGNLGGLTSARATLPPTPRTPGAVVTNDYVCIPQGEAAELLLWVEHAEAVCR